MSRHRLTVFAIPFAFLLAAVFAVAEASAQALPRDETFDVNVPDKRIVETDFHRALSASVRADRLTVEAGAAVSASRAVITIRNAVGRVRFKISNDAAALLRSRR